MLKYERQFLLIFCLIFLIILFFFFKIELSPDSKTYLRVSKSIVGFRSWTQLPEPLYLMSYLIFKFISITDNFEIIFKCVNALSFSLIIIFTLKILKYYKIKFNNHFEYIYFLILFFLNFDILQWTKFALTDLLLLSLMMAAIYFFLINRYITAIIIFLFSLLIKPQSIFIFFTLSFLFFLKKKRNRLFFSIYFCFYTILILSIFYINNLNLGFDIYLIDVVDYIFIQKIIDGNIVDDRYFVEFKNIFSIFKIYFLRFIYFFSIFFDQYSLNHKIYKVVYFILIYFPIVAFIFQKEKKLNKNFLTFSIGCIIIISTFIILTFIDYDLRYRIYIYPFAIMISTYCLIKINIFKKSVLTI